MRGGRVVRVCVLVVGFTLGLIGYGWEPAQAGEPKAGTWTGGGALGFLGDTPDGTAFALNFNAEAFLNPTLSVGPLLQLGFTGDLTQIGLSGQAKYWIIFPNTANRVKLNLQGGFGFVHADFLKDDTSWLIPLGVGVDYAVSDRVSLTATFLLNFTNLHTGFGTDAHVMPGLTFGLRF